MSPEPQTGALGWREMGADQPSILIGWRPTAAGEEQEVTCTMRTESQWWKYLP